MPRIRRTTKNVPPDVAVAGLGRMEGTEAHPVWRGDPFLPGKACLLEGEEKVCDIVYLRID